MSYLLEDQGKVFLASFSSTSENQFSLLLTNCSEFFIEKLSYEVLKERLSDANEDISYKVSKALAILKENSPESCTIKREEDELRVDLKFIRNSRPMMMFFLLKKNESPDVIRLFTCGLLKQIIEDDSIKKKMRKAIEAKDLEIQEYKLNGGRLIRGKISKKFCYRIC